MKLHSQTGTTETSLLNRADTVLGLRRLVPDAINIKVAVPVVCLCGVPRGISKRSPPLIIVTFVAPSDEGTSYSPDRVLRGFTGVPPISSIVDPSYP